MVTVNLSNAVQLGLSSALSAKERSDIASARLSSGQKVRSALDDPSAYFTSIALSDSASSLDRVLSRLAQSVKVVGAADNGLKAMLKLSDNAEAIAGQAKKTTNLFERSSYAAAYNQLLEDMAAIARDSGYGDRNLLGGEGNDFKLYFSEDSRTATDIRAVDFTDMLAGLGLPTVDTGTLMTFDIALSSGGEALTIDSKLASDSTNFAIGDVIEVRSGVNVVASITVTSQTTVGDLTAALSVPDQGFRARMFGDGNLRFEALGDFVISGGKAGGTLENIDVTGTPPEWSELGPIEDILAAIDAAQEKIKAQAADFATDLTMLQKRETFMTGFSQILISTSEQAIAADINEESANLLALQIRQQLSMTSVSLTQEADQGILRMLGA